ncbi:MAG: DUF2442 domain-containing protein [Tepidiformaceae bacterium]
MSTSAAESPPTVGAESVSIEGDVLTVVLTDARQVVVDITRVSWLQWLLRADPSARSRYEIEEPDGFAIYWPDLDDGIEVAHLLTPAPVG